MFKGKPTHHLMSLNEDGIVVINGKTINECKSFDEVRGRSGHVCVCQCVCVCV
jgi:hypothetical protein